MSGARSRAASSRRGGSAPRPARPAAKPGALARLPRPGRHWIWVAALVTAFFLGVPLVHAFLGEIAALGLLVFLAGFAAGRLSVKA
ncbi:MAG TPA: hypothetical protein VD970_06110 [Acetobacteraceae bacterium]|nr:hypothetical protein [Acetobacteraceae bacterium]